MLMVFSSQEDKRCSFDRRRFAFGSAFSSLYSISV